MKCSAFWKHTNIRPGNRVFPCCRFKEPVATFNGDLNKVLHSKEYETLRMQSSDDEYISGCEKCYLEESLGHKSLRQEFNESYDFNNVGLEYLEIGLDNLCNLVCDGCNSEFSTSWMAEEKLIYGEPKNKYLGTTTINSLPSTLKKILFLGGEPLITNRHLDVIQTHPSPKNCELHYNTNASFIPDKHCAEVWSKFKKINFIVSIDGVGHVQEQVRSKSTWVDLLNFLDYCRENRFDYEFNTVLHKNNLFDIENLINFIGPYNKSWYINVLTYPENLSIKNLSASNLEKFLSTIDKLDFPNKQFIQNFVRDSL